MEPYRSHMENLLELISFYQLCLHLPEDPTLTGQAAALAEKIASRERMPESMSALEFVSALTAPYAIISSL